MTYNLVVSFPDQSPSFVHGYEVGYLSCELLHVTESPYAKPEAMRVENEQVIRSIAEMRGWDVEFTSGSHGYLFAVFTRKRPRLRLVKDEPTAEVVPLRS